MLRILGTHRHARAALLGGTALANLLAVGAAQAQSTTQSATNGPISEVVVTAQKQSESIQSVPISMTALGSETLQRLDIQSLQDLSRQVPSLVVISAGPGENELIIRGISSTAGTTSTVGYYLDDTPLQPSSNAALLSQRGAIDPSLVDVERVEVLRGPQGTLYGSSSMGGTVKYVSFKPDTSRYEVKLQDETGQIDAGGPVERVNATVNVPLVDNVLAARVSTYYSYEGGYIDRYQIDPKNYLGIKLGSSVEKNVNTDNNAGVRAQLLFQPDPTLSITPSIFYQYMRLGAPYQVDVPPGSLSNLVQARDVSEVTDQRSLIANITINKEFPLVDVTSATSYFDREVKLHEDSSKVLAYYFSPPQTFVYPSYMLGMYLNKEFTQELRAATHFQGPLQVIAGGYFHRTFAPLNSVIPDPVGYDKAFGSPFGGEEFYAGARKATLQESAFFTEASLKIWDDVTARAGLRVFNVSQRFFQSGNGVFNGGYSAVVNGSSENGVNPKFTLEWQIDPERMVYTTASSGYRPGGPNNPAPAAVCGADVAALGLSSNELIKYNSDNLWNYEVGAKTEWLDKKLTVNADVYYIDWRQVQQQIVLNCGFNITANFGSATSKGAEMDLALRPMDGLKLTGGMGYTDATLGNGIPGTGASSGDQLTDSPRWTLSGSAQYTLPINDFYTGFGLINATYVGNSTALYDRSSPFYQKKGYGLVNLRLGVDKGTQWEAAAFVNNLFNQIGETDLPTAISADLPTTRRFAINQPRMLGLTLSYKY